MNTTSGLTSCKIFMDISQAIIEITKLPVGGSTSRMPGI
jgi:hypothetical protein